MKQFTHGLVVSVALMMTACASGGPDDSIPSTTVEGSAVVPTSSSGDVEFQIDPKSLEVLEICRSDSDCDFRQRCGRLRGTLINHSDQDVTITGMIRSLLRPSGDIERERRYITAKDSFTLKAGGHQVSHDATCMCEKSDPNCIPEFPHRASPFMWGKSERVEITYRDAQENEYTVKTESPYTFTRKPQ